MKPVYAILSEPLALAFFFLTSPALQTHATVVSIPVADDAATFSFWTAGGFGPSVPTPSWNEVTMYDDVDGGGGRTRCWLKFTLEAIPAAAQINSATLYCNVTPGGNAFGFHLGTFYAHDNNWFGAAYQGQAGAICWDNQPTAVDPAPTDSVIVNAGPTTLLSWDVSSAVAESYGHSGATSLVMKYLESSVPNLNLGYDYAYAFLGPFGNTTESYLLVDYTVPEPATMIAGALLLLPFGASALRLLRRLAG
jgi:hypothetical protein